MLLEFKFRRGYSWVHVEYDSPFLIKILEGLYRCPWSIQSNVAQISYLRSHIHQFTDYFSEAYRLADLLANERSSPNGIRIYRSFGNLPHLVREEVKEHKLGFLSIRQNKKSIISLFSWILERGKDIMSPSFHNLLLILIKQEKDKLKLIYKWLDVVH